jgi:hypothetical protein
MAQNKQQRPKLSIKAPAKARVEEMFGGTADVNREGPTMEIQASIPLPEHADADPGDNLSVRDIKDRVEGLFRSIGTSALPDTVFPPGPKNNGLQAAEFVIAEQLKKLAEKRYETAKAEAKTVGCFGLEDKYIAGDTIEVYRTPHFTFSVQRNNDSQMIDRQQTEDVLKEIAPTKWQDLLKRCEKPKAGATRFIVALR